MKRMALVFGGALALLLGVAWVRTLNYRSAQTQVDRAPVVAIPDGAAERLAGSLRFRTVSSEDSAVFDKEAFVGLHRYLRATFPNVHRRLQCETVGTYSLLYTWRGSNPALRPILLMGHLDVVPVDTVSEPKWREDPFGGKVANGFIHGRGAIDNKSAVVGTLEATEMLLNEGFRPTRTIYFAYGHDEEVGGSRGAREIVALLERRGTKLDLVLDEGGVISIGVMPGSSAPVALVGIAEKGFASVELSTRAPGGHSSMPPPQSAIGVLSAAVMRLEEHPMPARLEGPTRQLFDEIGPRFPYAQRATFANLWLTRPLVIRKLEESPSTNAMIRTTMAATIFQAGEKENVLPQTARAVVNVRILPGDSVAGVLEHVRRVVDDPRVTISPVGRFSVQPSDVSRTSTESFRRLARAIRGVAPDVVVAPYLSVVGTDARHYTRLSENVFRFLPLRLDARDLERIHGVDERLGIRSYEEAIRIYRQLIRSAAAA